MKILAVLLLANLFLMIPGEAQTPAAPPAADAASSVALMKAVESGDIDQIKGLIDHGAEVNGTNADGNYRYTALDDAADSGKVDVMKYLISRGAKLDLGDSEGSTALLHACSTNHTDCALALLDAKANPNLGSQWGRVPLMYAAQKGNDEIVAALLAHNANVDANCSDGPPIWWAAAGHHFTTLKLLVDAGAKLDLKPEHPQKISLLAYPASTGDLDTMDLLVAHGVDVNQVDSAGDTLLILAAEFGQPVAMKWLLDKGAQIDIQDKKGRTALMWACRNGSESAGALLVDRGADVNLADIHGETALTYAGNIGKTYLVSLLESKGAKRTDVHLIVEDPTGGGLTPAQSWALGLCAIYTQKNFLSHKYLGGNPDNPDDAVEMLRKSWRINDRDSLVKEFNDLIDTGHRLGYKAGGLKLSQMSDDDFNRVLAAHPANIDAIKAERASYLKWNEKTGFAWDYCRAANIINNAYVAKNLRADEAWSYLLPLARKMQAEFGSWQEMSDNFLDAREIWAGKRDADFEACSQLLLKDPNSPWNQNPWKTDLSGN